MLTGENPPTATSVQFLAGGGAGLVAGGPAPEGLTAVMPD